MMPYPPRSRLAGLALSLVLAGACGDDPLTSTDGGPDGPGADLDAPGDAPGTDAPATRGPVTVHVNAYFPAAGPDVGATVYFADASGTLMGETTVDAAGNATGMIEDGGSVTVHYTHADHAAWQSVMAVVPGDELWFGNQRGTEGAGSATLDLPAASGAQLYSVWGPCVRNRTSASPSMNLELGAGCPDTRPLLARVERTGQPTQFLPVPAATLVDQAELTATGPWQDAVTGTTTFSGVPTEATGLVTFAAVLVAGVPAQVATAVPAGNPLMTTWPRPDSFGDGVQLTATFQRPEFYSIIRQVLPVPTAPVALDLAPRLPRLTAVTPLAGGVSWTLSGSGPVDLIMVAVTERGQKGERVGAWTASLPGDATALVWPRIPGAPFGTPSVRLSDIDIVDGYHQLRARAASTDWIPATATGYDVHSTFR